MRGLFSKSLSVIIINVYTAFFLTIALSNLVYAYHQTYQYADGIKGDFCSISFNEADSPGIFFKEFYESIADIYSNDNTLKILRYNDTGNCGVYFLPISFYDLDIQSGRNFEFDDFKYNKNVAVVSELMKEKCIDFNGIKMIQIGNGYYEVIGFFKHKEENAINPDSHIYYNLFSENMLNEESGTIGQIVIESDLEYDTLLNRVNEKHSINQVTYPARISFRERLSLALFSQSITIVPLCLVLIAVILNSINITINWVNNNKKELVVRKICGANMRNLNWLLIRKYLILTSVSYVIGFVVAFMLSRINYSLYIGFDFSIITILGSYMTTLLMSAISILIMLTFGNIESVTALRRN